MRYGVFDLIRGSELFLEELAGPCKGFFDIFRRLVLYADLHAPRRAPGGDIPAHRACADDMEPARLEARLAAESLEPILQEKYPDEIACGIPAHQFGDGPRLQLEAPGRERAAMALPQPYDGVGCGVVLFSYLGP